MTYAWLNAQNPTIIYIGDPMCSWCYGFAPEISALKDSLPDHQFELVLGGLRPGGTETMQDLGEFLSHHWKEVEARTSQPFNYGIIGDAGFVLDTEPGCRAVVAARTLNQAIAFEFFKAVQHAFYVDNKDMRSTETFADIAEDFGLDRESFISMYLSEDVRYATTSDFQLAAEMGIRGFPSVVVRHNGQFYLAANGYRTAEDLIQIVGRIQAEK